VLDFGVLTVKMLRRYTTAAENAKSWTGLPTRRIPPVHLLPLRELPPTAAAATTSPLKQARTMETEKVKLEVTQLLK